MPRVYLIVPIVIFLLAVLPDHGLRISSGFRFESAAAPLFALVAFWLARPGRGGVLATIVALQLVMQIWYAWLFSRGVWVG